MALRVSTVDQNVTINDLGIVITHPTASRDLTTEFTSRELKDSSDLTNAIQAGLLVVDDGTFAIAADDYDPDEVVLQELGIDLDTPDKNDVLMFNGTSWLPVPEGTTFTFSIATFTDDGGSAVVEIGTGDWKASGELTFSASYNNGPATDGYVSLSGWGDDLTLESDYEGPTDSVEAVSYPSVGSTRAFVLHATDGTDNDTDTNTYYFYNRRFWGVSSTASSYSEADVEGLANDELSNSRVKTFTVTAGAGEYIIYAYPDRLGAATFTVGGFEGGFEDPETVSVTNTSGYTEDYYVYRSTNAGLGETTVVVS